MSTTDVKPIDFVDILQEVPVDDWPSLKDVFRRNWPTEIYAHYVIQNYLEWTAKDSSVECKIYSPHGRWNDGTVIIEAAMTTLPTLYIFTMEESCELLKQSLLTTKQIDWSKGHFLYGVHKQHWIHVEESLRAMDLKAEYQITSDYYWIPNEKARQFHIKCPDDVNISSLTAEDIETIDSVWPHRYPGSKKFLQQIIDYNGGLGVYRKSDNALCSWIFKNQLHGLGILQTADEHKRKGYAKILIMALSKKMAIDDRMDIHACIVTTNSVSQRIFKSLGFKQVNGIVFEQILKKSPKT